MKSVKVLTQDFCILQVLQKFPDGLQYEIHLHMHLTVLSDSFLFNDFNDSCLRALSKKMHRHHHLPGHQILHEGDDVDSVHLVRRGKIDIMVHGEPRGRISELKFDEDTSGRFYKRDLDGV